LKILLIGLGSIGKKHWQILTNLNEWGVFEIELHHFTDWESADKFGAEIAFICNPTFMHIDTAIECANRGMHLFIEKPIDCKLNDLDKLINIVASKGLTSYVAYPLRHNRAIQNLGDLGKVVWFVCNSNLKNWRQHKTYSADWRKGGGAMLELSHEIDLAEHLMGPIVEIDGTLAWIKNESTNAETGAYLRIRHNGGALSWHSLEICSDKTQRFVKFKNNIINIETTDQMFLDQAIYFLNNIGNSRMMNNIVEASKLFRTIMAFREGEYANRFKQ